MSFQFCCAFVGFSLSLFDFDGIDFVWFCVMFDFVQLCILCKFVRFLYLLWVILFGCVVIFWDFGCRFVRSFVILWVSGVFVWFHIILFAFLWFRAILLWFCCDFVCFRRFIWFFRDFVGIWFFCATLCFFVLFLCGFVWFYSVFRFVWSLTSVSMMTFRKRPVNPSSPFRNMCAADFPTLGGIVFTPKGMSKQNRNRKP